MRAERSLMRVGVLTGGGDAPGLNAAIRAVARRAFQLGHEVIAVRNGWAGCLEEGLISLLTPADIRGILPMGGTLLGTSRTNPLKEKDGISRVIANLKHHAVDGLVAIGGDDTLSVAAALHDAGFATVGVPKTIDNDLSETEFCIGFDTAVGVVMEALDRLHTTASAHHRVMVVEVMGRDTGWVGMLGGLAGGADLIIIPEFTVTLADVVGHLYRRRGEGKLFSIIVVCEGAKIPELIQEVEGDTVTDAFGHVRLAKRGIGDLLATSVERETGYETRVTVLGHLQRGGSPSPIDRIWSTRLGVAAAELIVGGQSGVIPIRRHGGVAVVKLADVLKGAHRVPKDLYELSQVFA
jgi:ATP-dependent phosphofructokinase / diphosphate-dependent phosphofructokinase